MEIVLNKNGNNPLVFHIRRHNNVNDKTLYWFITEEYNNGLCNNIKFFTDKTYIRDYPLYESNKKMVSKKW